MDSVPRRKACVACADSKRRCDRQLPECQRCLDRDVKCTYPQPKKRQRNRLEPDGPIDEFFNTSQPLEIDTLETDLDFEPWDLPGDATLDLSLFDILAPAIPPLSALDSSSSDQTVIVESTDTSSLPCPWFLQDETWVTEHVSKEVADYCTDVEVQLFIQTVGGMLQFWVKNGYNHFIHHRLYEKGLPKCLQDAFTTFAAYASRTPAVKATILQIADERSIALARQEPPHDCGVQGILAHLARVQALFVYEFIRLFDGSVRLRASAEQQLPTLLQWTDLMWEAVKRYQGKAGFQSHISVQSNPSDFDGKYNASSELWKLWILTESVRRTFTIADTLVRVYQAVTKGSIECEGVIKFTARRGLWEAELAEKWYELSCAAPPLLVPSLEPGPLISRHAAEEIDDFVKAIWPLVLGKDKFLSWIDRSKNNVTRE